MRRKKTTSGLELYAVSGTHTVVLSLDMKAKPDGLLGFAFERVETKSKKRIWLYGQKFFHSVIPIDPKDLTKLQTKWNKQKHIGGFHAVSTKGCLSLSRAPRPDRNCEARCTSSIIRALSWRLKQPKRTVST